MKTSSGTFRMSIRMTSTIIGCICWAFCVPKLAFAIDWNAIEGREVMVFHTGQASWEWSLTQKKHSGAKKFKQDKTCQDCHEEEEPDIGKLMASGEKLEPTPIKDNAGSVPIIVKFAKDATNLYTSLEWTAPPSDAGEKMDPDFESKVTVMLAESYINRVPKAGCWVACHDDVDSMASHKGKEGLTKYLRRSRTKMTSKGGGKNYKPDAEIDAMLAKGYYMDYWQARLNAGTPASPMDGHIFKDRIENNPAVTTADAEFKDGKWSVVLTRPLKAGIKNFKDIEPGKMYYIGFALHDGYKSKRFHKVSFEYSLMLDKGDASFVVKNQ